MCKLYVLMFFFSYFGTRHNMKCESTTVRRTYSNVNSTTRYDTRLQDYENKHSSHIHPIDKYSFTFLYSNLLVLFMMIKPIESADMNCVYGNDFIMNSSGQLMDIHDFECFCSMFSVHLVGMVSGVWSD